MLTSQRPSFVNDIDQLEKLSQEITYPALIKPRNSSGSRGIQYVEKRDDLTMLYLEAHKQYPFPIIQEYLPDGEVFGVGLLLNFSIRGKGVFLSISVYAQTRCKVGI